MMEGLTLSQNQMLQRVKTCELMADFWVGKPLIYGVYDCAQMARDLAMELGAKDPMKDWPKYSTRQQGVKSWASMGFRTFTDAVTSKLKLIPVGFAQDGDIVELKAQDKELRTALTVKISADKYLTFAKKPNDDIRKCWVIGFGSQFQNDFAFTGNAWRVV